MKVTFVILHGQLPEILASRMYNILFLMITLHMLTTQGIPLNEVRLQNLLHSDSVIFTREEAEAMVNQSQSYGTSCDSLSNNSTEHLPVYATSLCPWYYEIIHQADLFPSTILRAKQRCTRRQISPCRMRDPMKYTCVYIRRGFEWSTKHVKGKDVSLSVM